MLSFNKRGREEYQGMVFRLGLVLRAELRQRNDQCYVSPCYGHFGDWDI